MKLDRVKLSINHLQSNDNLANTGILHIKNKIEYVPLFSLLSNLPLNIIQWEIDKVRNNSTFNEKMMNSNLKKKLGKSKSILHDNLYQSYLYVNKLQQKDADNINFIKKNIWKWICDDNIINTQLTKSYESENNTYKSIYQGFFNGYNSKLNLNVIDKIEYISSQLGVILKNNGQISLNELYIISMVKKEYIPLIKAALLFNYEPPDECIETWVLDKNYPNTTFKTNLELEIVEECRFKGFKIVYKTKEELLKIQKGFFPPSFKTTKEKTDYTNSIVNDFLKYEKIKLGITKIKPKFNFKTVKTKLVKTVDVKDTFNLVDLNTITAGSNDGLIAHIQYQQPSFATGYTTTRSTNTF